MVLRDEAENPVEQVVGRASLEPVGELVAAAVDSLQEILVEEDLMIMSVNSFSAILPLFE